MASRIWYGALTEARLIIAGGPEAGREFAITGAVIMGRDASAGIVVDDEQVSRRHTSVELAGDTLRVEDLGSTNGTFLNGERIEGAHGLKHGDKLRLGQTVFEVQIEQPEQATKIASVIPEEASPQVTKLAAVPPGAAPTQLRPVPPRPVRPVPKDLRAYLDALEEIGELQRVEAEVNLDYELGAIVRRSYDLMAPAPLFTNIAGVTPGFRVLGAPAGVSAQPGLYLSRVAISLGLDPRATGSEIVDALVEARDAPPIPPRIVSTGPCKEVIATGDEVDLGRLPAPLLHGHDGGRFLNTYGIIVARTPDGSWTNWSISRTQFMDARRMSGLVVPTQHLGVIHAMWRERGEDMPVAVAMGVEPVIPFVGGMPLPDGVNEADFIGAYLGEPIDVVRCETVDLEVPATAEIVIEGMLSTSEVAPEGPMGEFAGFTYPGDNKPKPVYHVSALTHRTDPILPSVVAGHPVEENHTAWGIPNSAEVLYQLRRHGVPATSAFMPLESGCQFLVIAVPHDWRERMSEPGIPELMDRIADALWTSHTAYAIAKAMVTEDDIDPSNTREVVWAFAAKHTPSDGVHLYPNRDMVNLPVFLPAADRATFKTTKVIYNCLLREDLEAMHAMPVRSTFSDDWPVEIQERVLQRWSEYGYTP